VSHQGEMKTTNYPDAGKPDAAVPVTNECGEPAAFIPGPAYQAGPISNKKVAKSKEMWPGLGNQEACPFEPDGTYDWRNQADGFVD
jgi:hypothetical protein